MFHIGRKIVPEEAGTLMHLPEPAAVLAIGPGGDQPMLVGTRGEAAAMRDLVGEPGRIQPALLGVGDIAITRHDGNATALIAGQVGPKYVVDAILRMHMHAVDDDVLVARLHQGRDHLHRKRHLRRPEAPRRAAEDLLHQFSAGAKLLLPVRDRDQREDRIEITPSSISSTLSVSR